jgi:formimidoylglutamate deiminase
VSSLAIPGFVDAHCHAFQRALRGRDAGRDFWAWRDDMVALAESLTVEQIEHGYREVYRELRANGFTAVGEFHYLGPAEARAAAAAASEAGIAFVCVYACYLRGGSARFRQSSVAEYLGQLEELRAEGIAVAVAPHSVRACPAEALRELGAYAESNGLPLHVHADEQPREIEECLAEHGVRPITLLAREGCLSERTTIVHATHADGSELDLVAGAGARICVCPTTEASLGDGFLPVQRVVHRRIELCIGSDSNVRIDPLEELRELEGIARRQTGTRGVLAVDELLRIGSANGAGALALEAWPDAAVDLENIQLRGVAAGDVYRALVFSCGGEVLRNTLDQ